MTRWTTWIALVALLAGPAAGAKRKKGKDDHEIRALVQTRLTWESGLDEHPTSLTLPRARLCLGGRFVDELRYNFSVDFGDFRVGLANAYLDVRALGQDLQVRVGHFKRPFSRQRLTSVRHQAFVDRSIVKKRSLFGEGRDLGVMLHDGLDGRSGLEWAFGFFGDVDAEAVFERYLYDSAANTETAKGLFRLRPTLAARIGYHTKRLDGYMETDRRGGPPRLGGSGSVMAFLSEDGADRAGIRWEADVIAKMWGLTLSASVLGRAQDAGGFEHDALGVYALAAYRPPCFAFVEGAVRYAGVFEDVASTAFETHELTFGANGYFFDDHLKVQMDVSWLPAPESSGPAAEDDFRVRFQVQVQ